MTKKFSKTAKAAGFGLANFSGLAGLAGIMLAACSTGGSNTIPCPEIKAATGGEVAAIKGSNYNQDITVRLNGVNATCFAEDGGTAMIVEVGLLAKRNVNEEYRTEQAQVTVGFADIDGAGAVIARETHSDTIYIPDYENRTQPIFTIRHTVVDGARVVIAIK